MSSNGNRRPPRPRIELELGGSASPQEAAAVVAALERFLADTSPAPAPIARVNPWQRAALLEGVRAKRAVTSPWGTGPGWIS